FVKYCACDKQCPCECIHSADVGMENVCQVGRISSGLRVEVDTSRPEPSCLQDHQHCFSKLIEIIGELVGIPAVLVVAAVGVDTSQQLRVCSHLQFVLEGMLRQRGVIHFDVKLEIIEEIEFSEKRDYGSSVKVILMLGGFHRLRLDKESSFEAIAASVVTRCVQESSEMFLFPLHIGVQQRHVT